LSTNLNLSKTPAAGSATDHEPAAPHLAKGKPAKGFQAGLPTVTTLTGKCATAISLDHNSGSLASALSNKIMQPSGAADGAA